MKKRQRIPAWRKRKRLNNMVRWSIVTLIGVAMLILLCLSLGTYFARKKEAVATPRGVRPQLEVALLTPNEYSRPQTQLSEVNGVVIHYTANPGTTGWDNQHYFENLKDSHSTKASSHFIIGLDGTIIQCIPLDEIAYASNKRNEDTISIECCHPKEDGKFTDATYQSLVKLTAWLAGEYNLKSEDIIRHYDVTGKICPKYFVEHEDAWEEFKQEVFPGID